MRVAATIASSVDACIFSRISFVGMSKEEVLHFLGDPETISDYGQKRGKGPNDSLVYRFDTGTDGAQWTLQFQNGVVSNVAHLGID